jgi:hypothetical protein
MQRRFGADQRRQAFQPRNAGANFGTKRAHLRGVTAAPDCVAIAARGASTRSIRHRAVEPAQDNCFAIFGRRYL